ncbi:unnamed protein product, partial [Mycena citricolor]
MHLLARCRPPLRSTRLSLTQRFTTAASNPKPKPKPWLVFSGILVGSGLALYAYNPKAARHAAFAGVRCSRVVYAACLGVLDYKATFARAYASEEDRLQALSECHSRSASHVLKALLANGGIFIKLGQHMASVMVLPREWTSAMRPLQDKCDPTSFEDIEALFRSDVGASLNDLFYDFNPVPIGVASLAQVHVARDRKSGRRVAVKIQHPHLAEFCDVDMAVVESSLGWIKYWFPDFEFTWLADEMKINLPL